VIEPLARKPQTGRNIFRCKIRQFFKHLYRRQAVGEQIEHIRHTDAHVTNAWAAPTLLWIDGDTFRQLGHTLSLLHEEFAQLF
jgi:hypothetical protein